MAETLEERLREYVAELQERAESDEAFGNVVFEHMYLESLAAEIEKRFLKG